jgi:outer membrane protein TolC
VIPQQGSSGVAPIPPAQTGPLIPPAAEPPPVLPGQTPQVQPLIPQQGQVQPQASPTPALSAQTNEELDREFEESLKVKPIRPKNVLALHLTDAVRIALVQNSDIRLSAGDARIARGTLLKATSAFDASIAADVSYSRLYPPASAQAPITEGNITNILNTVLSDSLSAILKNPNADLGTIISNGVNSALAQNHRKAEDIYTLLTGVTKKFRNGLQVSLQYKPEFEDNNFDGVWPPPEHLAQITLNLPVLKFGVALNAADEMSAQKDYEAALLTLNHTVEKSLSKVVDDYWQSIASLRKLENADMSFRVSASLYSLTNELVKASSLATTELSLAEAKRAEAAAARDAALIDAFQKIKQLATDLGMREDQLRALPFAADELPNVSAENIAKLDADRLIDVALAHRFDRLSAMKAIESKRITANRARYGLRPDLTLRLTAGLTIDDDKYSAVGSGQGYSARPNFSAGLGFSWAPANNLAKGNVEDAEAKLGQAVVNLDTISHAIIVNIRTLDSTLGELAQRILQNEKAVESFEKNLTGMRERFSHGAATLLDTFQAVTNLITARNSTIDSRLAMVQAVSQLRFETGTLLTPSIVSWIRPYKRNANSIQITKKSLTTLPTEWEVAATPQEPIDPWSHERRKKSHDRGGTY